jgi:hypothetical protein
MIRVYLKYMAAHPEDENKNAVLCMTRAALDAKLVLMQRVDTTPPAEVH